MDKAKNLKPRRRRIPRIKGISFNRILPNIITLSAACSGITGIKLAIEGKWEFAVLAIILAAILDALDGRMARLLKAESEFGAQLDSLADVISFGVAPALILYFWSLHSLQGLGWAISLFFAVCCCMRLARFNAFLGKLPPYAYNYFQGVPAPLGALLGLLPIFADLSFPIFFKDYSGAVAIWLILISFLMVSTIPTFSFKKVKISQNMLAPLLGFIALILAVLSGNPWKTITILCLLYLALIPLSVLTYARLRREALHMRTSDDSDGSDGEKESLRNDKASDKKDS